MFESCLKDKSLVEFLPTSNNGRIIVYKWKILMFRFSLSRRWAHWWSWTFILSSMTVLWFSVSRTIGKLVAIWDSVGPWEASALPMPSLQSSCQKSPQKVFITLICEVTASDRSMDGWLDKFHKLEENIVWFPSLIFLKSFWNSVSSLPTNQFV